MTTVRYRAGERCLALLNLMLDDSVFSTGVHDLESADKLCFLITSRLWIASLKRLENTWTKDLISRVICRGALLRSQVSSKRISFSMPVANRV